MKRITYNADIIKTYFEIMAGGERAKEQPK